LPKDSQCVASRLARPRQCHLLTGRLALQVQDMGMDVVGGTI